VFPPAETADWFEQILDGLAAAHEHGVVHRDLKPENIVGDRRVSGSLVVKILDFGLAKIRPPATETPVSQSITQSGALLGTPAYMSPEQLRGKAVDHRTDIYAAGVILAEMLTGRRPCDERAPLPPALDAVLQRCLAEAPEQRFASALELRVALIPALRT
jgi:serine/threonine-protein kinase